MRSPWKSDRKLDALHPKLRVAYSSVRGFVRGTGKSRDEASKEADRVVDLLQRGLKDAGVDLDAQEDWFVHNTLAHPLVQFLAEADLEQVGEALHSLTLPPDGALAEAGAFAAWLAGSIQAAIATQEPESEAGDKADSKRGPMHRLAAAAAIAATLAGGPRIDADRAWRADIIAFDLDAQSKRAVDRAIEVAKSDRDPNDQAALTRVADALRTDGFADYVTPEGYLRVKVRAARTGTQIYSDGFNTWGEYRDASEVFASLSLESWGLKPFTNDHPSEWVGIDNWAAYTKGTVGQDAKRDSTALDGDEYVLVTIQVSDLETLKAIRGGKVELSAGYSARLQRNPGRDYKGREYEFTQHDIFINHLSLVDRGRAGPLARVSLDGFAWQVAANEQLYDTTDIDMATPNTIKVPIADSIFVDLTQADADAFKAKRQAELDAAVARGRDERAATDADVRSQLDAQRAQLDAQRKELDAMKIEQGDRAAQLVIAQNKAEDAISRAAAIERRTLLDRIKTVSPKLKFAETDSAVDIMAATLIDLRPDMKDALDTFPKTDSEVDQAARARFIGPLFDAEIKAAQVRIASGSKSAGDGAAPVPRSSRLVSNDEINRLRDQELGIRRPSAAA